jgi:hypothetical protein
LNGRVKAYEGEEALKEVVIKSGKLKTEKKSIKASNERGELTIKGKDDQEIIL